MWKIDDTTIVFGPMDCPTPDWRTPKQVWSIYLISTGIRTYVGSTTDVHRRLRQHNREIVGGARSTASGAPRWKLVCWVSGFDGRSSACRWEKLVKSRARGLFHRSDAMYLVSTGVCPPMGKRKQYEVPQGLELHV